MTKMAPKAEGMHKRALSKPKEPVKTKGGGHPIKRTASDSSLTITTCHEKPIKKAPQPHPKRRK